MRFTKESLLLYAITDRRWLAQKQTTLPEETERVLAAGATCLQLREKDAAPAEILELAAQLLPIVHRYNVPFILNDDAELALQCGADGVHVGQSDIHGRDLRALLGPGMILGVSANTVETAQAAERAGADYIGVGAVFGTATKGDAQNITVQQLQAIRAAVSLPIVAIGGITTENIGLLAHSGIDGVSVISAIFAAPDSAAATRTLLQCSRAVVGHE